MRGALARRASQRGRSRQPEGLLRELAVVATGALVYFGGRKVVQGSRADAVRDAEWIIEFERWIGLDREQDVQRLVVDNAALRTLGNLSYVWLHWPLLVAVLAYLFRRDRRVYHRLRDAMFASGAVALVLFAVFPAAPPRFMPGFVGTVSDDARRHYLAFPMDWSNPYASFPSFHVGWTLVACLAVAAVVQRRALVALAMVPAGLVGLSVVSTGNHYFVDAIGGATIALVAYAWSGRRAHRLGRPVPHDELSDHALISNSSANRISRASCDELLSRRPRPRTVLVSRCDGSGPYRQGRSSPE